MKILFISDNFFPESNAPAVRTYEHAKVWIEMGHEVTVITCNPNFPEGIIHKGYSNGIISKEIIEKIKVLRVWSLIAENKGFFLRILDHLSFCFTSAVAGIFMRNRFDIVVGTSPQFFTILSTFLIAKFRRKKWIFEVRDLWPESLLAVKVLKRGVLFKLLHSIEKFLYRKADHIVTVTHSFREQIIGHGIKKEKISVVTNGIDTDKFHPDVEAMSRHELGFSNQDFVLGYVGTLGMAHGIDTILDAANLFKLKNYSDVKFLIIGTGAEKENLLKKLKDYELSNTIILDKVEREQIPRIIKGLNASIVCLRKSKIFKKVIPSKIFESIALARPILLGVEGESKSLIEDNNYGIFFEPENSQDLFRKIL